MKFGALLKTLMIAFLAATAGPCAAAGDPPQFTLEGLQLIEDSNLALVYAEPGIDLSRYNRIYLDTPSIAFRKNWRDNQNRYGAGRISDSDMEKIKAELATLFLEVFSKTLEEGGYELADGPGDDVLGVKSAIINLDIVAPDVNTPGITRTYSESAGEMTLYMELYDSVSGDLLAKALDRREDRRTGYFQWRNRVTNRAAANRILKVWAGVLKEGLDDARKAAPDGP
jgi:hypothetical protein